MQTRASFSHSVRVGPLRGPKRLVAARAGPPGAREPWDFGRFVKTMTYFGGMPNPAAWLEGIVKGLSGAKDESPVKVVPIPAPGAGRLSALEASGVVELPAVDGIIMVTGATGGVGKRVVQRLLAAGRHVRCLVRDVDKATALLSSLAAAPGSRLEIVAADLTQRMTLLPEYFRGVRAMVVCSAVKVGPKDDDSGRSKYYQGIKFYNPEILDNSPEAVELGGMRHLLDAAGAALGLPGGLPLLQAAPYKGMTAWGPLDDVVMGGVSISEMAEVAGAGEGGAPAMVFRGLVSTSNSGGFASVRCKNYEPTLDLGAYGGLELRLRGDGQRYKCIVRADSNWDGIAYCRSFDTSPGAWQTIRLPWSDFKPVFRARSLKDGPRLDPSSIASFQLMLSKFEYDGELNPSFRAGSFELPIAQIRAYPAEPGAPAGAKVVHVSSAGVTRPNRPGINPEMEPPAVRLNDSLGGILTYKLAAEDALRQSGFPFAIVRPCALTEEPRGMPLEFDQGDVIKGKVSREDVAELCVALLSLAGAAAVGTTFEVKSTVPFSQPWAVDEASPPPRRDWGAALRSAQLRPGVTGKTVGGVYTGKGLESEAPAQVPAAVQ